MNKVFQMGLRFSCVLRNQDFHSNFSKIFIKIDQAFFYLFESFGTNTRVSSAHAKSRL